MIVGIDIGTSYSSIFILDHKGIAQPVKVSNGACIFGDTYSMPSAVYVNEDGNILIGQLAISAKMKNPSRFKGEFKRDLGQLVPYNLGQLQLLPEDLYKEIFVYFKECAEESSGEKIKKAYITYPANFNKRKRELVENAAKLAGLLDVELIDEPTAAALCYCSKGKIKEGDKLLVYDFGGGTFDVALIEYVDNNFRPLTQALGIDKCGGVDIDRIIFDDIMSTMLPEVLIPIESNKIAKERFNAQIMELSIKIKHQLSSLDSFKDGIAVGFEYIDYELSREKLNQIIASLVDETLEQVRNVIKNAGLIISNIDTCVLVGGTCRIPYIKDRLENLIEKHAFKDIDPELAVCIGASMWKNEKEVEVDEEINSNRRLSPIEVKQEQEPVDNKKNVIDTKDTTTKEETYSTSKVVNEGNVEKLKENKTSGLILVDQNGMGNCATVQQAIDMADASSRIIIHAGTYTEDLIITKPLTIDGFNVVNEVVITGKIMINDFNEGKVIITNCRISGEISLQADTSFTHCKLTSAATAIWVEEEVSLEVNDSEFIGNAHGIYSNARSVVVVKKCKFTESSILSLRAYGKLVIYDTEISRALRSSNRNGIYIENASLEMINTVIKYCNEGINCVGNCKITVKSSEIVQNYLGIHVIDQVLLDLEDTKVSLNMKQGILASDNSAITIMKCILAYNKSAVEMNQSTRININDSVINSNDIGIKLLENSLLSANSIKFNDNKEFSIFAAGINKNHSIQKCNFVDCAGLSVVNEECIVSVFDSTFDKATKAVVFVSKGKAIINNCVFNNNYGVHWLVPGRLEMMNSILNTILTDIDGDLRYANFINCIFRTIKLSHIPINEPFILENDFIERACKIYSEIGNISEFYCYKNIIPQKMLEKAKLKFLGDQDIKSVIFFFNAGLFMKGSVGLAITKNGFFWRTDGGLPCEVRFNTIKAINIDGSILKIVKMNDEVVTLLYAKNKIMYFILKVFYNL